MRIIEIAPLENGAHRNQTGMFAEIPEGWALIPEDMKTPDTFPFVDIKVKDGIVTGMTAGEMPEPEPEEESFEDLALEMLIDLDFRLMMLEEFGGIEDVI